MVNPDRTLLQSLVEVDETEVPLRSKHDPMGGYGIPNVGKLLIIGAVEIDEDNRPRRLRLEPLTAKTGPQFATSSSGLSSAAPRSSVSTPRFR